MARILVVSSGSLFGKGLEAFLRQDPALEVVGVTDQVHDALDLVRRLRPDVLVLQSNDSAGLALPPLMCCLRDRLIGRIIALDPHQNTLCVFTAEHREVRGVADLAKAIAQP